MINKMSRFIIYRLIKLYRTTASACLVKKLCTSFGSMTGLIFVEMDDGDDVFLGIMDRAYLIFDLNLELN